MSKEHVLVCLSSSETNRKVISSAAHMASVHGAAFSALFVETAAFRAHADDRMLKQLSRNRSYAAEKGAHVETIYGDNVAYQIAEYARQIGASMIILGSSPQRSFFGIRGKSMAERIMSDGPDINLYVVPLRPAHTASYRFKWLLREPMPFRWQDILITVGLLGAATAVGLLFGAADMGDSNIIPLYILVVLAISVLTSSPIYGISASILSVFVFNWFFTEPKYTLRVIDNAYFVTFLVMFVSALLTSSLTVRLKDYARHAAQNSYRTKVLLDTSQLLQQVSDNEAIAGVTAAQIAKLSEKCVVVYLAENDTLKAPKSYPSDQKTDPACFSEIDREAAHWAWVNRRRAGAGTAVYPSARMLYLSIRIRDHAYGVIGIDESETEMDAFLLSLLLSIMDECAMAMENEKNVQEREKTEEAARNQKFRADLLRSISHDLRTPLTSIYGNASILETQENLSEEEKKQMYSDIAADSMWLIEVVQNLLAITRLESGEVMLHKQAELMDEVIDEAMKHLDRDGKNHHISVHCSDDILMAKMDARLMVEVIVNLVNNAIKYTQNGSDITIQAWKEKGKIWVSVADNGPGMSDEQKENAFKMFYTGSNQVADARRSLGIGLSLCQSILTVHDGTISVQDNHPCGTVFTFALPAEEVNIHEQ